MIRTLKSSIAEPGVIHVMATHSLLSAKLAEEAGFDALWASGFELSAPYGLADVSLISMTQHLDMVRSIAGQTDLPIVADIDTGYGNAVNVDHVVREYRRQAGLARAGRGRYTRVHGDGSSLETCHGPKPLAGCIAGVEER